MNATTYAHMDATTPVRAIEQRRSSGIRIGDELGGMVGIFLGLTPEETAASIARIRAALDHAEAHSMRMAALDTKLAARKR